jgi:hypothetical protein
MEILVDQIELQFILREGITHVKVLLVRNGIKTCVAEVPVLKRIIVLPLHALAAN